MLERIYISLPSPLQRWILDWEGRRISSRRYGIQFERVMAASKKRESLSQVELDDYRGSRLSEHFKYAQHSPFWAERFARFDININASDPFTQLAKLPILTKAEVQEHAKKIQNPLFLRNKLHRLHTSGTTGSGLVFRETLDSESQRWAVWWRYRNKLGIRQTDLCALFGGRCLIPLGQIKPPFWRHSHSTNQILFSSQHLSKNTFRIYLDEIKRSKATWIHGYPSVLGLLATWMIENDVSPPECVKFITTGAENLTSPLNISINKAFKLPVYQHYGLAESTANFSQAPEGKIYVDEDFSHVEFSSSLDGVSKIIGTNWHNPAFPLFRYDSGDLCQIASCHVKGPRSREILAIDGRQEDVIILKNGVNLGCLNQVFVELTNITGAQIIQTVPGKAEIRIIKGKFFNAADGHKLHAAIKFRFGNLCDYHVIYVDQLERTANGKLRLVISTIAKPNHL